MTAGGNTIDPEGGGGSLELPGLGEVLLTRVLGHPARVPQQLVLVLVRRSVVIVMESSWDLGLQESQSRNCSVISKPERYLIGRTDHDCLLPGIVFAFFNLLIATVIVLLVYYSC